ncbi:ATP-binding protein [soil metagenome]
MKPLRIALTTSLLLAGLLSLIEIGVLYFLEIPVPWVVHLIIFGAGFLFTGFAFRFIYGKYIYSNLSRIHRNILRLKDPRAPIRPFTEEKNDITSEINRILVDWNNESREEIDHLKQIENYRRDFLSNVSHELKTPIFSIQGYVHTLIDGGIEDAEVNILYLNKASKSIDRLINIVDDLESISKMEAGELSVEPRTFDIKELVNEVFELLEIQGKEKNVKLIMNDKPDSSHYVYADRDMVRQVMVNLVVNSIKYGKKEGTTEIRFSEDKDKVIVDIEDDGIGIEKLHLPRLFERFYRVDKSRSREQGGTGLGLAIVKHIIEAHQQYISVNSEVGKGTTFTFSLKKSK